MKHSQRGYSLVELSLVLAIIAVLIAGAITGTQSILRSNNVVKTITQTNNAVNNIISKFVRDSDYQGVTMANLATQGMSIWESKHFTATNGATAGTATNPFGTAVFVAPLAAAQGTAAANQAFIYTLANIPVAACVDLALGIESLGVAMSVDDNTTPITAAPTSLTTGPTGTLVKDMTASTLVPIKSSTVASSCGSKLTSNIRLLVLRQ